MFEAGNGVSGLKLKRTKFDTAADVLCIVCIVGLIIYLTAGWNSFPYEIAGHYNAAGQPDRMGSRA